MKTDDITLFVFDELEHFDKHLEYFGDSSFNDIIRIDSLSSFKTELEKIDDNQLVFLVVHVFYTQKNKGIKKFITSKIKDNYPLIDELYVSDGAKHKIQKKMIDSGIDDTNRVKQYYEVQSELEKRNFKVFTKKEIIASEPISVAQINTKKIFQIDYVIITALEEDEMEKVLPMITKEGKIENKNHLIEYGHFKFDPQKKVAYASQLETGMVDASILATEMILTFKPKFVIMTGVLGGKPEDTNIGDIVVSNKVFTIDKGKLNEDQFKKELESVVINNSYVTGFKREKKMIKQFIEEEDETRKNSINIHFEPIACVRSVIDKKGFFIENISTIDRKTIGLEMESYGIARACEVVNNGKSIPIIIKSVMDNTQSKTDNAKTYAAWTSAKFLEYVVKNDLL